MSTEENTDARAVLREANRVYLAASVEARKADNAIAEAKRPYDAALAASGAANRASVFAKHDYEDALNKYVDATAGRASNE